MLALAMSLSEILLSCLLVVTADVFFLGETGEGSAVWP